MYFFMEEFSYLGTMEEAAAHNPTHIKNIDYVRLANADIDNLYATSELYLEPSGIVRPPSQIPEEWDWDTIMSATYDDNPNAGNVSWMISNLSAIAIRRKSINDMDWVTLYVKQVNSIDDILITDIDITPIGGIYQYALVPIINNVEGNYNITEVETTVAKLVVMDPYGIWSTYFEDGDYTLQHVMPSQAVETMYGIYPTIIRNTNANYRTMTVHGRWLPEETDEECDPDVMMDDVTRIKYREDFLKWLHNGHVKLLKTSDSMYFLGYLTTPASVTIEANSGGVLQDISFGLTETGKVNNEKDMWDNGFTSAHVPYSWVYDHTVD